MAAAVLVNYSIRKNEYSDTNVPAGTLVVFLRYGVLASMSERPQPGEGGAHGQSPLDE